MELSAGPSVSCAAGDGGEARSRGHRGGNWITRGAPPPTRDVLTPWALRPRGEALPGSRQLVRVGHVLHVFRIGTRVWDHGKKKNISCFDVYFMNALLGKIFHKWLTKDLLQRYSVADKLLCLHLWFIVKVHGTKLFGKQFPWSCERGSRDVSGKDKFRCPLVKGSWIKRVLWLHCGERGKHTHAPPPATPPPPSALLLADSSSQALQWSTCHLLRCTWMVSFSRMRSDLEYSICL